MKFSLYLWSTYKVDEIEVPIVAVFQYFRYWMYSTMVGIVSNAEQEQVDQNNREADFNTD
jgi:hypothetical protein